MHRQILGYALLLAGLTWLLKWLEYRYWVRDFSMEAYVGAVALLCAGLGLWAGWQLTRRPDRPSTAAPPSSNGANPMAAAPPIDLTEREYDILRLMAAGHSNQEIADRLFISTNTVKTHASNLFAKLDVKRRTQAVRRAQEMRLL